MNRLSHRVAAALFAVGCSGPQSALAPAAPGAERIATLFWAMVLGAAVIWATVVGLAAYASYAPRRTPHAKYGRLLIVGGGVVLPAFVLTGLLTYSLAMLPDLLAPAPPGSLKIHVLGYQWWWRVRYLRADGSAIELANEIHLPVDAAVELEFGSADVIHSFWVPPLGGKVDMIPGRRTRLALRPTKLGVFRGACAEYCGASHAVMSFFVVVQPRGEFESWLAGQARPALEPVAPLAARGQALFLETGCGACHSVRGSTANGAVGPDLTHVGGRMSIAAGALSNRARDFETWLAHTNDIKPSVLMPSFAMLPPSDSRAMASYLESLK